MAREMKDSGVEWIGKIPKDWSIERTLYVLAMPITDGPHTTPELLDDGIPFVSAEAVSFGNGKIDFSHMRGFISDEFYRECCKKYIPQINDIYMIKSGATTGKVAIVDTNDVFTIWSPLAVFRCNENKMIHQFMFYSLQSDYFQKQVEQGWTYGTQQNIGMRTLERLRLCCPSIIEQYKISNYLDEKCAEIDSLVIDIQSQIDILEDYKKSVITETVTKGLNPNVEMKDSEIEWIGKIPKHWTHKKMKYIILNQLTYGANESGEDFNEEFPRYIRITDIDENNSLKETGKLSLSPEVARPYLLKDDDILFARSGATVGKTFLYQKKYGESAFAGYLIRAQINKMIALPKYIYYSTLGIGYENWKNSIFTQATIQNIGADKYSVYQVPIPTISEQQEIVEYLNQKCFEIDNAIKDKKEQLDVLEQYKKSLIYEYVTGKKEVPDNNE